MLLTDHLKHCNSSPLSKQGLLFRFTNSLEVGALPEPGHLAVSLDNCS